MARDDDRPGVVRQGTLDVFGQEQGEVVGRLVEQQDVGRQRQQDGEVQPTPLPDAQAVHRPGLVAPGDQTERGQRTPGSEFGADELLVRVADAVVTAHFGVLAEQGDAHARGDGDAAAVGSDAPRKSLEQCRLAASVRALDEQTLSGCERETRRS